MMLQQLEYAVAAADAGSFSDAAERLGVSQNEIYDAVAGLELALDISIFVPTRRGLSLTPEGKELLGQARQIVDQVSRIEDRFIVHKGETRYCSVSARHYDFAAEALGRMTATLQSSYEFTIHDCSIDEVIDDVRDMRSELGLLHISEFSEKAVMAKLKEARLSFHPLFDVSPLVILSSNSPQAAGETVRAEQLRDLPLVCYAETKEGTYTLLPELYQPDVPNKELLVSDRAALVKLIQETGGFCLGVEPMTGLAAIPLDTEEQFMVGWIEDSRGRLSDQAQTYLGILRQVIAERGYQVYPD